MNLREKLWILENAWDALVQVDELFIYDDIVEDDEYQSSLKKLRDMQDFVFEKMMLLDNERKNGGK